MRQLARQALFYLAHVVITVAVLAGLAGLFCFFSKWGTVAQYGFALMWAGLITLGLAGASFTGNAQLLGNPNYWYVQSVMPQSMRQRWQMNMNHLDESFPSTLWLGLAGLIATGLGFWLQG